MSTATYPNAEVIFQQHYESSRRDEVAGALLALFLGCFGVHHFYLGRTGLGILYCLFCWTGIPAFLGVIECFLMPGRVRQYNAEQAEGIAWSLGIPVPVYATYPSWAYGSYGAPAYAAGYQAAAPVAAYAADGALIACSNCQHVNRTGSRFCSGCGTQLT